MNMYYIAIVAPEEVNKEVLKWKNYFKDHFECTVALKSPAHITLIPPFWMKDDLENELVSSIRNFSITKTKFKITLKNFAAYKPKVIFVDVAKSEVLNSFYQSFANYIFSENKFPIKKDDRPFHPHITLATKDLYKKAFQEAWEVFSKKKYEATWSANGISLLRHNKKNWDVIFTSQLED
ncbi:MAG TPA: 2'-5' RNA ligase family protein [Chitinophagaceae bacterium]|nr:2'-5' RNA ligase family protein [Chitinophagaceae bacterium]